MYGFHNLRLLLNVEFLFLCALILICLKFPLKIFFRNPKWVKFAKQLPGPYAYPLVGNTFDLMIRSRNGFTPLLNRYIKTYGKTFRLWIGRQLVVVLSDPKDVQTVLLSSGCLGKPDMFVKPAHQCFGDSLVFAEPSLWKHKRRTFQPFFTKSTMLKIIPIMNKFIYKNIEELKKLADGPEFNVKDMMKGLSLEIILKSYLDFEMNDIKKKELETNVVRYLYRYVDKINALMMCDWQFLKMIVALIIPADAATAKKLTYEFIDEALNSNGILSKVRARNPIEMEDEIQSSETLAQAFLNRATILGKELGDEELVQKELMLIITASVETTAVAPSSCIFALATHPEIQERVYQEICDVFGDDERLAEESDLDKFPYLDQVLKETARFYTVGPVITRNIPEGTKIGNYIYPGGTTAMICISGIHHDPEIYPNPDQFNPDNFTPEAISKRHKFSFIPFSGGPRNCLGKPYAEISMKLRLIAFLRTFSCHTTMKPEDIKLKPGFVEESANGYPVSIKLRRK